MYGTNPVYIGIPSILTSDELTASINEARDIISDEAFRSAPARDPASANVKLKEAERAKDADDRLAHNRANIGTICVDMGIDDRTVRYTGRGVGMRPN